LDLHARHCVNRGVLHSHSRCCDDTQMGDSLRFIRKMNHTMDVNMLKVVNSKDIEVGSVPNAISSLLSPTIDALGSKIRFLSIIVEHTNTGEIKM